MSLYDAAVPAYLQILGSLQGILDKAEVHCTHKKIEPEVLLQARLFPDMLPFTRHVQTVTDFAMKGCARLTGSELPSTSNAETSFSGLKQGLANAADYVKAFDKAQFDGAETRSISFPAGPDRTLTLSGQQFLSNFSLPNFYFHAAIAHGILRHNGVELGKRDFMGA